MQVPGQHEAVVAELVQVRHRGPRAAHFLPEEALHRPGIDNREPDLRVAGQRFELNLNESAIDFVLLNRTQRLVDDGVTAVDLHQELAGTLDTFIYDSRLSSERALIGEAFERVCLEGRKLDIASYRDKDYDSMAACERRWERERRAGHTNRSGAAVLKARARIAWLANQRKKSFRDAPWLAALNIDAESYGQRTASLSMLAEILYFRVGMEDDGQCKLVASQAPMSSAEEQALRLYRDIRLEQSKKPRFSLLGHGPSLRFSELAERIGRREASGSA